MKKQFKTIIVLVFGVLLFAGATVDTTADAGQNNDQVEFQDKAHKLINSNKKLKKQIRSKQKKLEKNREYISQHTDKTTTDAASSDNSASKLAQLDYAGKQQITVNNNNPQFSQSDLSTANGAWQSYGNLDSLNRVTAANALLNKSLMPSAKRERLFINPTGWHNKRIKGGWLYNRSHLIGYQFTGQNNNMKNLMTGTASLNSPEMQAHEMDVAYYLKGDPHRFVRYRVTPVFRGNELLARGVQMEAQSVGDNSVHFNVYIFNVQSGVSLNYADGTSRVG